MWVHAGQVVCSCHCGAAGPQWPAVWAENHFTGRCWGRRPARSHQEAHAGTLPGYVVPACYLCDGRRPHVDCLGGWVGGMP